MPGDAVCLSYLLAAMPPMPVWLAVVVRILHILAAATVIGAAVFQVHALLPSAAGLSDGERVRLRDGIVRRWRAIAFTAMALLLVTGLITYALYKIPEYHDNPHKGLYHGLLGVKILLALLTFHVATVMVLPGEKFDRKWRSRAPFWLRWQVILFLLIVVIASSLRYFKELFGA